jgi:hypothetical protein
MIEGAVEGAPISQWARQVKTAGLRTGGAAVGKIQVILFRQSRSA